MRHGKEGEPGHLQKEREQAALTARGTPWRGQREEHLRTKESKQTRGTHSLRSKEVETSQSQRKQESRVHSHSEAHRVGNQPGHRKKVSGQGALTFYRACGEE